MRAACRPCCPRSASSSRWAARPCATTIPAPCRTSRARARRCTWSWPVPPTRPSSRASGLAIARKHTTHTARERFFVLPVRERHRQTTSGKKPKQTPPRAHTRRAAAGPHVGAIARACIWGRRGLCWPDMIFRASIPPGKCSPWCAWRHVWTRTRLSAAHRACGQPRSCTPPCEGGGAPVAGIENQWRLL